MKPYKNLLLMSADTKLETTPSPAQSGLYDARGEGMVCGKEGLSEYNNQQYVSPPSS
jgi:hypothetical protein